MLSYLRARALSSGFLGGSRMWISIGAIVWTIKFFQWLVRPETEVIYREPLGSGQSLIIRQGAAHPSRRQRKKLLAQSKRETKHTKKEARRARRATKRALDEVLPGIEPTVS